MPETDAEVQRFADKLVKAGREAVAWEKKKLEWILEQKKQTERSDEAS